MTSVNVTTQSNTVTVQQGDATTVTIATQGPQGPAGSGSSNVVDDTSPQLGGDLQSNGNDIDFADNDKAIFGTGSDLQIFHDGSQSVIKDNGTGQLLISGENTIAFTNAAATENYARFLNNGAVELYHNNVKKVETSATGIDVTGTVDLSSAESNSSNTSQFKLSNLTIGQHQNVGSYRFANAGTGSFLFTANNINFFNKDVNKNLLRLSTSAVELYHDNVKKAQTSSTGFDIPEDFVAGSGSKLTVGASGDLTFFHDSANSYVQNNTGDLILGDTNHQYFRGNTSDKSVSLYFNGSEKVKTTNTGITVTGSVTTQDMNMSNLNGTANEVDNTKGSWSIQEGADDLFLINRVSGKKYKFNLTEIS